MPALSTIIWVGIGALGGYVLWKSGIGMLRSFTTPLPPPPPAGEMRKINVKYRCTVCGLELKMMLAPDEDPPPPRHCLEDMDMVAPVFEWASCPQTVDNQWCNYTVSLLSTPRSE
ncbi:MAG: hypothetical protein IPP16_05740 [Acidimicrobiaceae bacterium]|nr:hypothetical protein [Acidimicrobiaceae bacterium]